ncbi:MAG: hypothetical protein MJZ22_00045 [Candidatus Saccharibacteria bacterium]|nr:hypothetical protein [Candidatus Saccharibacteria bacterium]
MSFWGDSSIVQSGTTPDGREVTIKRASSGGYVLESPGCAPKYSNDMGFLSREFDKQVPNDSFHRR